MKCKTIKESYEELFGTWQGKKTIKLIIFFTCIGFIISHIYYSTKMMNIIQYCNNTQQRDPYINELIQDVKKGYYRDPYTKELIKIIPINQTKNTYEVIQNKYENNKSKK